MGRARGGSVRRAGALSALLALVGATLAVLASPAAAQTGYPPPPCTATVTSQHLGTVDVGDTFTVTLAPTCVFQPGTPVTVTVNGVNVGTKVANSNGFVTVTITVLSTLQLSVDDPVIVPAICGENTVTATGFSAVANGTVTHTAVFTLNCAPAVAPPGPINNNNTNNNANNNANLNNNTVNVGGDTININTPAPQVVVLPGGPGGGPGGGQTQTQTQHQDQSQFQRIIQDIPKLQHAPGGIAFTGASVVGLCLLALTALLIGSFLLSSVKRRRQRDAAPVEETQHDEVVEPELTLS